MMILLFFLGALCRRADALKHSSPVAGDRQPRSGQYAAGASDRMRCRFVWCYSGCTGKFCDRP